MTKSNGRKSARDSGSEKQVNVTKLTETLPKSQTFMRPDVQLHTYEYARRTKTEANETPDLHVHHLFGIFRRRWGLVLTMAVLGALLATAALLVVPAKYTARAQLVVEAGANAAATTVGTVPSGVDAVAIDTQMTMLAARAHLRAVYSSFEGDSVFAADSPVAPDGTQTAASEDATSPPPSLLEKGQALLSGWVTTVRSKIGPDRTLPAFHEFESDIQIDQDRRSRVISVRYTSYVPEQAAAVASRVVQLYVDSQGETLRSGTQDQLNHVSKRIVDLERDMAKMEQTIRERLTQTAEESTANAQDQVPLRQLEREAAENAQLYVSLLQRQKQLRNELETIQAPVRIVSLASVPERPSSTNPKLFIVPAIFLSLIGGVVLAIILERFDRTLRSEHDVEAALGIPCVALIPQLGLFARKRAHEFLLKKPFSPYAEAIRGLGAALQFSRPEQPSQIMLVSSSVRSEGKTTLAVSLATYATQLRKRVLLIDLDFRNSSVAPALRLKSERGVVDLIVSEDPVEDVIRRVPELGLDVLLMPRCEIDPVTLFANGELQAALQRLRTKYDFIVIDGPPLLGVTEASLFASLADTVVFAVKWGSTRRDVVKNALGELRNVGWSDQLLAERFRAVVTQVKLRRHAKYRYGDAVELVVRDRNYYAPPHQQVKSLADLTRLDESLKSDKTIHTVAAE